MDAAVDGRCDAVKKVTVWCRLDQWLRSSTFAYVSLGLLQLIAVWGMWDRRDMTPGDTSGYYSMAWGWYQHFTDNFAWSPLYTTFYGSMFFITQDVFLATILHRLIIIFTASFLVLAVMRRILPHPIAWIISAWWCVLPINFNTHYEVHLFSVLPVLVAWLVAASRNSPWNRAGALAILVGSALMVRNEHGVAAALFGCFCLWRELQALRGAAGARWRTFGSTILAYSVPFAAVFVVAGGLFLRSYSQLPDGRVINFRQTMRAKHELNMAQVFAYGYQQRHPEWKHSPWVDYQQLMIDNFGKDLLPLSEMIRVNPRAVLEHFGWNFSLAPNGLQLLLFNASAGNENPDYIPIHKNSQYAMWATIVLLSIWGLGLTWVIRDRGASLASLIRGHEAVWFAMICLAVVAIPIIATQRPRPSYLFALSIFLMACTGACFALLSARITALRRVAPLIVPIVLVGYWISPMHPLPRLAHVHTPLRNAIRRLQPYQTVLANRHTKLMKGEFAVETMVYVGHRDSGSVDYGILKDWPEGVSLDSFLEQQGINLVYLDEELLSRLETTKPELAKNFLHATSTPYWKLIGYGDVRDDRWALYQRQ